MMSYETAQVAGYHDPIGSTDPVCRCVEPYPRECPGRVVTLAGFLLARIAEDEAAIRALLAEGWTHDESPSPTGQGPMARVRRWTLTLDRVLAECEAKRRIVELHGRDHECPAAIGIWDARDIDPCPTLLVLAQPYVDHPDFRDEWRL